MKFSYKEPRRRNFIFDVVKSVNERYCHFPNTENEFDDDLYEDGSPEETGELSDGQSMRLKDILAVLKDKNIDVDDVVFTASFSDDHLCLEVVHMKKLNEGEREKDYQKQCDRQKKEQERSKQYELERIEQQMSSLKRQAERLKK